MIKHLFLATIIIIYWTLQGNSQTTLPINLTTGQPIVNIPIYTLSAQDLSIPISLNYTAGLPVSIQRGNDAYNVGVGWSLLAGGSITRVVKSLPDDYQGTGSDTRVGWLYGNSASTISSFNPQSRTTCSQDAQNYQALNSFVTANTDLEPDVFNFNFGTYSGTFVFDNNHIIQTLPYQDLKIQMNNSNGPITSFIITTNDGVQYTFIPTTTATEIIVPNEATNNILYLRDKIIKYHQLITYTTEWGLSQIHSPKGGNINIAYGGTETAANGSTVNLNITTNSVSPTTIYLANNAVGTIRQNVLCNTHYSTNKLYMGSISGGDYTAQLNYTSTSTFIYSAGVTGQSQTPSAANLLSLNDILVTTINESATFENTALNYTSINGRKFLQSVQSSNQCVKNAPYQFDYIGTSLNPSVGEAASVLPLPYTQVGYTFTPCYQVDYWGYFNGKSTNQTFIPNLFVYPNEQIQDRYRLQPIPNYMGTSYVVGGGADRTPDPVLVTAGSLSRIQYPAGGSVAIEYESNQYFDQKANQNYYGGGIRVKTVTIHDGINSANDIIRNYTYGGGLLVNSPQFALALPMYQDPSGNPHLMTEYSNLQQQTEFFMARSEFDLNSYSYDQPNVIYQTVTEKQTGKGYSTYTYSSPATYGITTSPEYTAPYQWQAAYSTYATTTNPTTSQCMSSGQLQDGYYGFPFPPNPNYSFERSLLQSVKNYNEAGQLVQENDYQYTPIYQNSTPSFIYGLTLDYDTYSNTDVSTKAFQYGKYQLYSGLTKYQSAQITTTYDPGTNFSQSASSEMDYAYTGVNHTLLSTSTTKKTTDGTNFTVYKKKYQYPQDFANTINTSPADAPTIALANLQSQFINNPVIEEVSTVTKPGLSEQVIGSALNKFNTFTINGNIVVLPAQKAVLNTNGSISFTAASVNSNHKFISDSHYKITDNYLEYNYMGNLSSKSDLQQNLSGMHYDHYGTHPTAIINGALANQVVYSGFDYQNGARTPNIYYPDLINAPINPYTFVISSITGVSNIPGRNNEAIEVPANFVFSKTGINKGIGKFYAFSCWLEAPSNGTLLIALTDANGNTSSGSVTYTASNSWVYYKTLIPVTNLSSTFNINVTTGSQVFIDDMLFCPAMAQVTLNSFSYNNFLNTSTTDPHANTRYFQYDGFSRPILTTDNYQNILKRTIYNYNSTYQLSAYFSMPSSVDVNTSVSFLTGPPDGCEPGGITRSWTFGDGGTGTGLNPSHTYTANGIYTVTLTVSSTQYGTVTSTQQITINQVLTFQLTACGIVSYDICSGGVFAYGNNGSGDCGTNMPVGTNTFTATNIIGCPGTGESFSWDMAYTNAPNTWINLNNNSTTETINVANPDGSVPTSKSYIMRCTMIPGGCTAPAIVQIYGIEFFAPNNCQ